MKRLKKYAFFVVSRVALPLYTRFPLFGRLKGAFAIIRRGDQLLLIERNDGRGLCLPGGLLSPWEQEEKALIREVMEETGMRVTSHRFVLRYDSAAGLPVRLSIFEVAAEGELRGSWEGTPRWVDLPEARARILRSQRRVVEELI